MSTGLKIMGTIILILLAAMLVTGIMWVDETATVASNRILIGSIAGLTALVIIINLDWRQK